MNSPRFPGPRIRAGVLFLGLAALAGCHEPEPVPSRKLVFAPDTLPEATAGQPYEVTITISNQDTPVGEILLSSGALPEGLTLGFNKGDAPARLSGTPKTAGRYDFSLRVWCYGTQERGQEATRDYQLVVR